MSSNAPRLPYPLQEWQVARWSEVSGFWIFRSEPESRAEAERILAAARKYDGGQPWAESWVLLSVVTTFTVVPEEEG